VCGWKDNIKLRLSVFQFTCDILIYNEESVLLLSF
jgi:hypothetical protein